ncbi:MAG: DedA family protein [Myxococcota bacterium]
MDSIQVIFEYFSGQAVWWGLLVLTASAMLEYIFPPFPGDTVTIVGAVLIPTAEWPWWGVFGAVMVGSTVGAAFNWWIGYWVANNEHRDTWVHRFMKRDGVAPKIAKLKRQFKKYGSVYISANRFLPAFRSLFFVSAGLTKLPLGRVLVFAALSAAVWNAALLGAGYLVGYNLDALAELVRQYTNVVWGLLGAGIVTWFVFKMIQRYRGRGVGNDRPE